MTLLWVLLGVAALALFIVLEGRRQARKLGVDPKKQGAGGDLLGVGMLELQKNLQADRRVEEVRQDITHRDRVRPQHRAARPGDGDTGADEGDDAAEPT